MLAQVITIERKKYATGLFWQPLAAGQNPRSFAALLAKQITGAGKLFAEFKSMVGVGSRNIGHRRGMKIAAVEVVNAFPEYNSFLAAFFVPQGFWVIAVRNNIIIYDQLFAIESDAKQEFANLAELPDWGVMIAPGYWTISRAIEKPLRDIVSGHSKTVLAPVNNVFGNLISFCLMIIFLLAGWHLFKEPIVKIFAPRPQQVNINQEALEEYKRQLEQENIPHNAGSVAQKIKMPYEDLPDAHIRADQCWRGIAYVMQPISGWVQTNAECDGLDARAQLYRSYGTLAGLHESVRALMHNVIIAENTDSDVVVTVGMSPITGTQSAPEVLMEDIVYSVNTLFQTIGATANVSTEIEGVGVGAGHVQLNTVIVKAASKLKPGEFIRIFDGIEPLYLQSAKWDARERTWNYEVKIYAK